MKKLLAYISEKEKSIDLFAYIKTKNKIDLLLDKHLHISAAARYKAQNFTGTRITGGKRNDFTERVSSIEIIEKEIEKESFQLIENYNRVMNMIKNNDLDEKEKTILLMRYINGYTVKEIAKKLQYNSRHCGRLYKAAKEKIIDNAFLNDPQYDIIFKKEIGKAGGRSVPGRGEM